MRDAIPTTLEGLSNVFLQEANKLQSELDALGNDFVNRYVITIATLPIEINTIGGKDIVTTTTLANANSYFDFERAKRVAAAVRNGNDERGTVSTLQYAYVAKIEHLRKLAADLVVEAHYQGV